MWPNFDHSETTVSFDCWRQYLDKDNVLAYHTTNSPETEENARHESCHGHGKREVLRHRRLIFLTMPVLRAFTCSSSPYFSSITKETWHLHAIKDSHKSDALANCSIFSFLTVSLHNTFTNHQRRVVNWPFDRWWKL